MTSPCDAPFKKVNFLSRDIEALRLADGSLVLKSRHPLKSHEPLIPKRRRNAFGLRSGAAPIANGKRSPTHKLPHGRRFGTVASEYGAQ
jgi:hypothetical protein